MTAMNNYMDPARLEALVGAKGHRDVVGGLWDVIGPLQCDFLISRGLEPGHRLLDIGCGALRGGVRFARYLEPGHYYGIDISERLLDLGYEREIVPAGLAERLPRANLFATPDFEAPFGAMFDFGVAISLFTHLDLAVYAHALERLAPAFRRGARLYASVFEGGGEALSRPSGIVTYADRDPFHFLPEEVAARTPSSWSMRWIGDWGHPREQQMIELTRA